MPDEVVIKFDDSLILHNGKNKNRYIFDNGLYDIMYKIKEIYNNNINIQRWNRFVSWYVGFCKTYKKMDKFIKLLKETVYAF